MVGGSSTGRYEPAASLRQRPENGLGHVVGDQCEQPGGVEHEEPESQDDGDMSAVYPHPYLKASVTTTAMQTSASVLSTLSVTAH